MPSELSEAFMLESLAQRYHITPDAVLRLPAWVVGHVALVEAGRPPDGG